jgi:hypothetical protein
VRLLNNTIEARDVRVVASYPMQQRIMSADGRLLLLRRDVIEATQQMLSSRQRLETEVNVSSDDDDASLPDDSDSSIDDILSHLRRLHAKRATVPNSERASLEKEIKRVTSLLDDLGDMDHDARLDAIQAEKRRMQIMERINAIGTCPHGGFEWIWRPERNSFQCAGGSHWASVAHLGLTEADMRVFEREQQ